ncbi:coenzyme F420-0:L-glutamate ligase [Thermasporomyces composti]|jgi:hypothetical protein|uniref:Coenzyme F420:L-glutamate ligase-like domain-containing protein n=1 Tax=Thermasporomyces composti TaxID=696763 RepID=A0A3D9VFA3_THECX|nr:coenzyme F420-0:L-glutamate ligase [Thermasporomyces composti]REF37825.1 hypothetical protein DFJ64_3283 [Thermasporomyces composti]
MAFRNRESDKRRYGDIVYYDRGTVSVDGRAYQRLAVQTHFVTPGESYVDLLARYVKPLFQDGDIVVSGEKVVSMCQNNIVNRREIRVGFLARTLSKFASSGDHGVAMDEPLKLQLAINLAGRPRILLAAFLSGVTKLFGRSGVFYRVAGHGIAGIDGFYQRSSFDFYKDNAILNPIDPDGVTEEVYARLGMPLVIVDANDFNVEVFGTSRALRDQDEAFIKAIKAVLHDNPAGQSDEMTPFLLIRPQPAHVSASWDAGPPAVARTVPRGAAPVSRSGELGASPA